MEYQVLKFYIGYKSLKIKIMLDLYVPYINLFSFIIFEKIKK